MVSALIDGVLPFQLESGLVRGRLVRLGPALRRIVDGHGYPPPVAALLGQGLVLTTALAALLKYEGVFTLQAQSDGPVSLLVCDITSGGDLRGMARFDPAHLEDGKPLLGEGVLSFTVDQGQHSERYQGIVSLEGGDLTRGAETYFRQSEQLASKVVLTATADTAAALVVQQMPGNQAGTPIATAPHSRDVWETAEILASSVRTDELLDETLPLSALAHRLFHSQALDIWDMKPVVAQCRCSEERIARTLRGIPQGEIAALKDDSGHVSVTCEFCNAVYRFDDAALERVYNPEVPTRAERSSAGQTKA